MSKQPNVSDKVDKKDKSDTVKSNTATVFKDITDITWRMFVPTIGLTLAGVYADSVFNTSPLSLIIGIILGTLISGLLVQRQLKRLNEEI